MRVPLIRFGADETPFAWWEWLFVPVMFPLISVVLSTITLASIPITFVFWLRLRHEERRLRSRLAAESRFVEWADIEASFRSGEGTLIVEHRSPKGPTREWWTSDDLVASAPDPLPVSHLSPLVAGQVERLQDYAASCAARYVNVDTGTAYLTQVQVPWDRLNCRKLAEKYPAARIVTLVWWRNEPQLYLGDFETVFWPRAEPKAEADSGVT